MRDHQFYIRVALALAETAEKNGEVPVGAVVVKDGMIIGMARNQREFGKDATAHAEILAIREACRKLGTWRLSGCDLYVTLEPCPMCAGAIVNARIDHVYFGAKDVRGGAMGSIMDLRSYPLFSKPNVTSGIDEDRCRNVLRRFFSKKRS